ncbi:DNA-directed RNA polymerase III subunit RPC7-like isoform X2 [Ornithodoros turicata]|uniref:DNA-directed RNA polymerase III subunit RPC7-like isoform X2 n=1 Tax=Ornithodoros turicata TaxID=34597 RepID=UPI003138E5CB
MKKCEALTGMAARGRGRGRGKPLSFNTEQLGFNKGDALPPPVAEPPPAYPTMQSLPAPLVKTQASLYIASCLGKQRRKFQESAFYILAKPSEPDIKRFSDKYNARKAADFTFDAAFLPEQLQPAKRTRARRKRKDNNATSAGASTKKWKEDDIEQKLRALEETEGKAENEESTVEDDRLRKKIKQEQDSEDQEVEEEVEDEEELEEETDYVAGYFDNGESYLDEEDDNLDDGPVY